MNILIFGPSGAGKGTQSKLIANKYELKHLQSGEILREIASGDDDFSKKVKEAMQEGFVPSEWIFDIIEKVFKKDNSGHGFIIDGFSRKLPEIEVLVSSLRKQEKDIDCVIVLEISKDEAVKRLLSRKVCPKCSKIIDIGFNQCSSCGVRAVSREDDNPESIHKRLDDYKKETLPVLEFLKNEGYKINYINGERSTEDVFLDICEKIEK